MRCRLRIAIVGYGIAGIAAAILLRRLGHDVVHFERAGVTGSGGAGLLLHNAGLAVLRQLGLHGAAMMRGAVVSRVYGETLKGRKVMDLHYEDHFSGNYGLGIQRAALLDLLRAADEDAHRVQTSRHIAGVDPERGCLFDRKRECLGPFDLIVAGDGARSSIRAGVDALVRRDQPYRWAALVCLLDDPNDVGGDRILQTFSGATHVSIWPVGVNAPGAPRRINVSINIPLARSESWRDAGVWEHHVGKLCPCIVPLLEQSAGTRDLLLYAYRDVELRRYHRGRVVFIGDAAHSMSPQLGQGASMALQDSWALACALERNDEVESALAAYDRGRRSQVSGYQRTSRWITPMFQSESRMLAAIRDRAFYPLSRLSYVKGAMLKTLSGQR